MEKRKNFNIRELKENRKDVDVEQLLAIISRLTEKDEDPLLEFFDEKNFCPDLKQTDFVGLKNILEKFIREKVIVTDVKKLNYLKELLFFDRPLEIFSTNYDTCIEQLSYSNHRRYSDGFDIYWSRKNFELDLDVKHYKMHGSVIWYENLQTKECVKIPVRAFDKANPIKLRLIYGDEVEPLLIYPAQKSEYVEALTELQLMFKEKLIQPETFFLVVVGYSFRDDYIIHMIWDAARVNENLHLILIDPHAQEIYEKRLKFINKEKENESRISSRVICLPYPFEAVIDSLKNYYLRNLSAFLRAIESPLKARRWGGPLDWDAPILLSLESCFLTKTEEIIKKTEKDWVNIKLGTITDPLKYAFKALLHSVICGNGLEERWLQRVNNSLDIFSADNLKKGGENSTRNFFLFEKTGNQITLKEVLERWLDPLFEEKRKVVKLLTSRYENKLDRIKPSLDKLENLYLYFSKLSKGVIWEAYEELKEDSPEVKSIINQFKEDMAANRISLRINSGCLIIEQERLKTHYGGDSFSL